ncbi:MAG: nucleoside triphosphate pyrophosphatase [PVC group bacterium]
MKIVLATRSPRRKALLAFAGVPFVTCSSTDDEVIYPCLPAKTARHNAEAKATRGAREYPGAIVLAADTVVYLDKIFGKPENPAGAREMLRKLSGRTHAVHTAVALIYPRAGPAKIRVAVSRVTMRKLDEKTISRYLRLVNPLDKAGGYAVQEHDEILIEKIEGSLSNVIGLPLEVLAELFGCFPETRRYASRLKAAAETYRLNASAPGRPPGQTSASSTRGG